MKLSHFGLGLGLLMVPLMQPVMAVPAPKSLIIAKRQYWMTHHRVVGWHGRWKKVNNSWSAYGAIIRLDPDGKFAYMSATFDKQKNRIITSLGDSHIAAIGTWKIQPEKPDAIDVEYEIHYYMMGRVGSKGKAEERQKGIITIKGNQLSFTNEIYRPVTNVDDEDFTDKLTWKD